MWEAIKDFLEKGLLFILYMLKSRRVKELEKEKAIREWYIRKKKERIKKLRERIKEKEREIFGDSDNN